MIEKTIVFSKNLYLSKDELNKNKLVNYKINIIQNVII